MVLNRCTLLGTQSADGCFWAGALFVKGRPSPVLFARRMATDGSAGAERALTRHADTILLAQRGGVAIQPRVT